MSTTRKDLTIGRRLLGGRVLHGCIAMLFVMGVVVSVSGAFQDTDEGNVGLEGIIPTEIPAGLDFEAWLALDGAWEEWSSAAADDVAAFYEMQDASIEEQREVLDKLKSRITVMQTALEDNRYQSLFDPLTLLHGRLSRRVDVAEALLDTLELSPEQAKADMMIAATGRLQRAVAAVESEMNRIRGGRPWLNYVRASELKGIQAPSEPPPTNGEETDDEQPAEEGEDAAEETDTSAADLELAKDVLKRLESTGNLSESQQAFLDRPAFDELAAALGRYVEAAEHDVSQPDMAKLRDQMAQLVAAIENYESDNKSTYTAEIRELSNSINDQALDGGLLLRKALNLHYLNYNLLIVASENFLGKATRETRSESRPVRDYIGGANVYGNSTTSMTTGIDLKPSRSGMLFDAVINGVTRSSTTGSTSQATIYSQGNHTFTAAREVFFDGEQFAIAGPGRINVNPNTYHTGASTTYDGGLFAGTARRRAMATANSRLGQSNARARQRITESVLPEFNQEVVKTFSEMSAKIQDEWFKPLRESGLFPDARSVMSTDSYAYLSGRVASDTELGGDVRVPSFETGRGLTVNVHESALNNLFAKMDFAGRSMTEDEIRDELERAFKEFFGVEVDLSPSEEESQAAAEETAAEDEGAETDGEGDEEEDDASMQFLFAETDPIRFEIEDGGVSLVLRTGLRREGKEDIPTQVITVPLVYRVEGNQIVIERGNVRVVAMDRSQSDFAQAGVLRKRVQNAFPSRTRDRQITIEREDADPVVLNVSQIKAINGWVGIWLD